MDAPKEMHCVEISEPGAPEVLQMATRAAPVPGHGEILIEVAYSGVNRPDALQRAGAYAPPAGASDLPGLECSGHVAALGPGVTDWAVGDAVCALLPGGGYAQFVTCPAAHALPVPAGISMRDAACLPETCYTVWSNMVMRGGLQAGERFLIHGGSSGIGTTAIQIATALGARVFTTAGSAEKCAACEELGATAINYKTGDFVDVMRAEGGANLIIDMVGGSYIDRNIKSLADDGRMVFLAFLEGPKAEINFAQIMARRLTLTGSTLRPQSVAAKAAIARELRTHVWPMLESGKLRVLHDSLYPLAEAAQAHARMESSQHIGKIVLEVAGG
ncbi:NAD(P)H-quinone oxidoreductase [Thioclava dalianensis]|uniref:NAD(P)H-quinone oxidoreductase n=1 Tax=Thioclava dalianensis TaxID=1185766 RepID=A0A074U4C4_9RHOB|nr:NAD(P)H-quinone oxidoreductase [Thioclava dalianensis]KEP69502.1 NAD(P)H-quinone oxidoreductase [Thioclava dalianensis]SFN67823.1 putative NAD(P)H quinone oxidoreductase, PIG3 family [Thioclava dalianensis]